jgi:hypothetical protein
MDLYHIYSVIKHKNVLQRRGKPFSFNINSSFLLDHSLVKDLITFQAAFVLFDDRDIILL